MCGQRAQNLNSETHCPRSTPGFARPSVGNRGPKREAVPRNFEFIVLPDPQLCAGGESRQSAIIAALVNGKALSYESRAQPVLKTKRSSRQISKAPRVSPKSSFVEVTKRASGNWSVSSSSHGNDGGDGSGLSYSWHSGVSTLVNGPCRLRESTSKCRLSESTSKSSTIVNRSPSMMVKSHMNYSTVSTAESATTVDNSNHYHYLRTILLILDDTSITFKNSPEPLQAEMSTVLSSLVVTYEMEKPKPWPYVRNAAQQTPVHRVAANKDVPHPHGPYEFAKARGYDFVRLKSYRLKSRRRSRNWHQGNKSLRVKYDGRFKSFGDKKKVTPYFLQTTKCQMQHCDDPKMPWPHILDSVVNDNELLESTRKDVERLGNVNRKLRKLGVAVSSGNNSESTKSTEDGAQAKARRNEGLESTASYNDNTRVLRKEYIPISQERPGSKGFSKSENGDRKYSEKVCDSSVQCLGSKELDSLSVSFYLPRLFAKTNRQYKWYNSLSATIFRETQLAKKNHADEIITQLNRAKLEHSRLCGEIQPGGVSVNHNMVNKTSQSSERNVKGCIDDMRLEEMSPLTNHIPISSFRDHHCLETENAGCIGQLCTMDQSLVSGNSNNNALPELQLSLDDLRNDFSYSEDEGDASWEPRRPREPSRSSCQVNEDKFTSSNQNTSNRGLLRLPLLLNSSSRRLTTSKKPAESASPIPPIASQKSVEDQCAKNRVKRSRRVKKEVGQTQCPFDLHKERLPCDMKSVRSKRRPTRLSPVVLKQPSNLSHTMNAQGEPQNEESNPPNAEKKVSSNVIFSTPKTSGLLSPCLVEDRRNTLGLPQSMCQHAFGDIAVSPVKPKQSAFLRSPDFVGFGPEPEHIVTAALAKETRFLPNLKHLENLQSNTKSSRVCNSNSSPPPNISDSHSLNTNNSSTRSRTLGSRAKNKIIASSITSGRRTLNHNCNAVPVRSSRKNSKKRVDLSRKLCQYQDKFIDDLDSELQTLIESHPRYQKSQASDINTSNMTRRSGHCREPVFENNGRAIRFGNMRQTRPTSHVPSGGILRAAVPSNFPERNTDRDYRLWSTNNEKSFSVQNQPEVSGNGQSSFQKNSESEILNHSTYAPYAHLPNTEKHDRQANYFSSQLSEENSSVSNNGVLKYNNDPYPSSFTRYFQQGGAEESMEVEETATEGGHYEMNLLAICRKLEERLQFSQGALAQTLESLLLSFGCKLESLLRSAKENSAHTASNNVVGQEDNESSSHQSNNETVSIQSEPETEISADSHKSSISETKSNSVKGILKTTETTNKTMPTAVKRKKVVIQSETSLKCASTSSKSSKQSDSSKNKKRFRSSSSSRSSKTSSKKHRRPRGGSQVYKGARHKKEEIYTTLNTHPRSKGRRTGTSYHSYQHSRACRRRHATEGICCNVCLERAVSYLKKSQSAHARRKNSPRWDIKKARGVKRKTAGLAKPYSQKSRDVSHKNRNTRRKPVVRKRSRSRNRTSNNSNGCNVVVHQRATVNQNRNQNSRPRKSKRKSTGSKVRRRRKITRPKVSYVITPKGQKTMYANLQKRYQKLVQHVENLNGSAKVSANAKHSDEYVQNLAIRFRNLVTNFPKDKLKTLETIFKRYQDASERYQGKDPNSSHSSSSNSLDYEQISKDKHSAPRPLKRKRPMEEPHASNASENIYSKTRRKQSHDSQNGADKLPEKSTNKKAKPAKAVDSLILNRRRLVELKNKSRNACLPTVNSTHRTRAFHDPAQKESFNFSHTSDSYTSAEYSVSNSGLISSCSSCENMINACFFQPLYLLQGSTPCISRAQTFNLGTTTREAQPESLFMQKSNVYCTSQGPFLNNFLSNAQNTKFTTKVPTNTPMKDGQDQSLSNYFYLSKQSNQQSTSNTISTNDLLHNDLQQQSKQRMLANAPLKQHCTDKTNNDKISGHLCSNRMLPGVSLQTPNCLNSFVSKNDEDTVKSINQSCFPNTLLKKQNALCPSKEKSVSNLHSSLGVLDNTSEGNETIREQLVNSASIFTFSSPRWDGLEPQFDRSLFKKSHLSDSKEKLDVSLPSNITESNSEGLANNNTDSEPSSKDSPIQNPSSVLPQASVSKSSPNSPLFVIRHVNEQNTQEVCLHENSPSTSSTAQSNSQNKTNNSMECLLNSKSSKKEIQKSQEPQSKPFLEKVQPYFIAHSPGISTTWKCYYDLPRNIRVATNQATKLSNTLSVNRNFAGTTTKQINDCASHNLTAMETNASTECSSADEGITKRHSSERLEGASAKEDPTSTDSAPESSIGENANDNARNVGMSWSANTIQEFGNLVGKTKSLRIDDFMNTSTASVNPWVANGHCEGSMVFFPGTECICHVDPRFSCAHVKAIDTRETNEKYHILRNGTLAQKCFNGPASSKMEMYRYFSPLSPMESVGHFSDKSALCSNKGTSPETWNYWREVFLQEAKISKKNDISIRKRHAKAPLSEFLVPPCKIPKLEIQSCLDQMLYTQRVSKRLRRSRFQLIRELRYLNKWQEAMEKLRRYEESNRVQSLITRDRSTHYDPSSDADSESSL